MFQYNEYRLRKVSEDDLKQLLDLKNESWFDTHQVSILNREDQDRWFKSLDSHPHSPRNLVLIFEYKDHQNIGVFKFSNIDWVNRTADVAWDIFSAFRRQGHGKSLVKAGCAFGFQILNLRRLNAEILETNIPSMKCAQEAGFIREGTKREAVHKMGKYIDSHMFGLLVSQFDHMVSTSTEGV